MCCLRGACSRLREIHEADCGLSLRLRCSCLRVWGFTPARRLLPRGCTRARPSNPATASGFLADRAARSTRPSWRRVLGPALCPHGSNTSFLYRAKSFPCVVLPLAARFMGRPILSRPCRRQGRPPASAPPVTTPAASWLLPLDFVAHSLSRGGGFHSSRPSRVFHRTVALW